MKPLIPLSSRTSAKSWSRTLAVVSVLLIGLILALLGRRAHATANSLAELRRSGFHVETRCEWHSARLVAPEHWADWWPTSVRFSFEGESPERLADALHRLQSVPALTHVVIRNARLTKADCRELVRLPRLSQLALHDSSVAGSWDWLEQLDGLTCLSLRGTEITDLACESVSKLGSLQHLDLIGSRVTDLGATRLSRLLRLTHLDLRGCLVSDLSIARLNTLPNLEFVDVCGTRLSHPQIQLWRTTNPRLEIHSDF